MSVGLGSLLNLFGLWVDSLLLFGGQFLGFVWSAHAREPVAYEKTEWYLRVREGKVVLRIQEGNRVQGFFAVALLFQQRMDVCHEEEGGGHQECAWKTVVACPCVLDVSCQVTLPATAPLSHFHTYVRHVCESV